MSSSAKLNKKIRNEVRRVFRQAFLSSGSMGHGAKRLRHCIIPPTTIKPLLVKKIASLCSLIHTICGNTEISEANAAPAPKLTKSAGSAQQIKVLELANRLTMELKYGAFTSGEPSSLIFCLSSDP